MGMSTDVNLPRSHKAQFPDRCVTCDAIGPNSSVTLYTGSLGWWTWILWTFGRPFVVRAPACRRCGWRLHLGRLFSLLLTIAITLGVVWWIWPHISGFVPRSIKIWAQLGLVLLCSLPYILYQVFFPPPFDMTAFANSVDYSFRNGELAFRFAILNSDAGWAKVNGIPISQLLLQIAAEYAATEKSL